MTSTDASDGHCGHCFNECAECDAYVNNPETGAGTVILKVVRPAMTQPEKPRRAYRGDRPGWSTNRDQRNEHDGDRAPDEPF